MSRALEMMRHALGFPKCYRNHYDAGNISDRYTWESLVCIGLAERGTDVNRVHPIYRVSEAGIAYLRKLRSIDLKRKREARKAAQEPKP